MSDFKAEHATRTATIKLHGSPDEVFPLFGPVREAEWAAGWEITVLHNQSSLLDEEGAVFTTHLHDDQPTIWIVTHYDRAARRIGYARITPGSRATQVLIQCEASENGTTLAQITYRVTGLSEAGNRIVLQEFSEASYHQMMAHWEQAINHRLLTGETIPHH